MNINLVALLLAASGLVGYLIMLIFFPMLTFERLLFLACFALPATFLYYWDRRQKLKRKMEEKQKAKNLHATAEKSVQT